ncbi:unnamed protein product [Linum tenue]|uniref:Leucine-rich repeat-containing N-terminal plant-type domain-containing protein n=1 Tax=Linum tenue TaxID=586396 RepID=A0AAV0I7F9_9ROSI|nr:unnamed protein product [Linum tenue]
MQEIKKGITHDPDGVFNSCNDSLHFCSWLGVLCDRCESDERVTSLLLPELNLEGTLPPHIGNLSFMNSISHANNRFHGQIPPQLGSFVRLQQLNLSENTIDGAIPVNLSHCSKLKILSLQINRLQGTIHEELGMEKYKWGGKKPSECLESESRWTQKGGGELGIGCRQRRTRETGWLERGREDAHDDCRRKRVVIAERFDDGLKISELSAVPDLICSSLVWNMCIIYSSTWAWEKRRTCSCSTTSSSRRGNLKRTLLCFGSPAAPAALPCLASSMKSVQQHFSQQFELLGPTGS